MSILQASRISFSYNGKPALEDISFSIEPGQGIFLLGHNGCGKTTLLKAAAGLLEGYSGSILLSGEEISSMKQARRAEICAFVPGEVLSPFDFAVEDTVLMGRSPLKKWWQSWDDEDYEELNRVLDTLGLVKLRKKGINRISTGERHLVFLAQALIQRPALLLLDEPSSHLDLKHKLKFFEILESLRSGGISYLMASHELKPVFSFGDSCLCLKDGKKVFYGPSRNLSREILAELYGLRTSDLEKIL
ncbi:MAG: ABC transporter ATP-binding protein [Elusimicrobiota bacterium]